MSQIQVDGRIDALPVEPQRVIREMAQAINVTAGYLFVGAGDPDGVIVANVGSLFLRTDGGAGATLFVKESDSGLATGWVGK